MDSTYLSNLRRAMSAAKTQISPVLLGDTILATQLAVSPPGAVHSDAEVATMIQNLKRTRHGPDTDMSILFRFLQVASLPPAQCERMAEVLIDKNGFKFRNPVDSQTLAALERAELESFEADEALLVAQNEASRKGAKVREIVDGINFP